MVIIIHSRKRRIKVNLFRFLTALLIMSCLATGAVSLIGNEPVALSANVECDTVRVSSGDTLWEIALEYNDGTYDTRRIVRDIIKHNNLTDTSLQSGQVIEIPGKYCAE